VFIARKLGFASVRIKLEDAERAWQINPLGENEGCFYQHKLPGHTECFIQLRMVCSNGYMKHGGQNGICAKSRVLNETTFRIASDLLAEAWAKTIAAWQRQNQLPVCFDPAAVPLPALEKQPEKIPVLQTATT
jgi:hypothetical protein